ncbi:hypothetical protein YC2023_040946 [Brassica napus]
MEWHQWRFLPFRTSNLSGTATAQTLFDEDYTDVGDGLEFHHFDHCSLDILEE